MFCWKTRVFTVGTSVGNPTNFLGGASRYNFGCTDVAAKNRCVAGSGNIACIINKFYWSERRDSNPGPFAPKTGQIAWGNLLKSSDSKLL